MIDLKKYSEKEVVAAIQVVESIVDCEDFNIDIIEEDGDLCFSLVDRQGAYLGDIGFDRFVSLGAVIDRMDTYHIDYFYTDYDERVDEGEEIPQDDWCRKVLAFFESDYVAGLLLGIDVQTYLAHKDKTLDEIVLNQAEALRYVNEGRFDAVGYVMDKAIALDIMETQSAYDVIEYNGSIYELYNNDNLGWASEFEKALRAGDVSDFDFCVYDTFADLIEGQKGLIRDDFGDIGLYDEEGQWDFYLSEYELEYIGLGEELKKFKQWYEQEFDVVVADAVERSGVNGSDVVAKEDQVMEN